MKAFIYSMLEKSVNRYMAMDPHAFEELKQLEGKTVLFDISTVGKFYFCPRAEGVKILADYTDKPDAVIKGSLFSLFKASKAKNQIEAGQNNIEISGDIELGQKISTIFRNIDIDWEEQSAKLIGDVAAHKVGNVFRSAKSWMQKSIQSMQKNVTEYVQEEKGQLPTRAEVNDFIQAVDVLRHDVERLALRVERLQ